MHVMPLTSDSLKIHRRRARITSPRGAKIATKTVYTSRGPMHFLQREDVSHSRLTGIEMGRTVTWCPNKNTWV